MFLKAIPLPEGAEKHFLDSVFSWKHDNAHKACCIIGGHQQILGKNILLSSWDKILHSAGSCCSRETEHLSDWHCTWFFTLGI
jgi:hypothetical protein